MALYIGNQRVAPILGTETTGTNIQSAELIYAATASYALNNFLNWDTYSTTPTTSTTLIYAVTDYTSTSGTTVIFDRYGVDYHNGAALDFSQYNYYLINECIFEPIYTQEESTITAIHPLAACFSSIYSITKILKYENNDIVQTGSTRIITNFTSSTGTQYNRKGTTYQIYQSTGYGPSLINTAPTLSETAGVTASYINFSTPSLKMRSSASNTGIASVLITEDILSITASQVKIQQQLYQLDKDQALIPPIDAYKDITYMLKNKTFPIR